MGVAQKMIDYKNEELCDKQTLAKLIYISCQNFSRINNQALQALMKFSAPQDAKKIKLQTASLLQIYSSNAVKIETRKPMMHSLLEKSLFLDPRLRAASIFSVFLHNGHIVREGVLL